MNSFFLDIWHDLREKRLWPVAAVLALAVLAVPAVLLKGSEPVSTTTAPPAPASGALSIVKPVDEAALASSSLDSFDTKNPFKSKIKVKKDGTISLTRSLTSDLSKGLSLGGAGGKDGGTGGGKVPTTVAPTPKKPVSYTYVADVTFGLAGKERSYPGLRKLEMLPSEESPLLVFLGATSSGDDAVFLVDQSLEQAGEGNCSDKECSLLALGAGSEHRFSDQAGNLYVLQVTEIRKVRAASAAKAAKKARAKKAKARASVGATQPVADAGTATRKFLSALLTDIETLTSPDGSSSPGS